MIKLTLDTNCIINLLDFKAKTPTSVDDLSEIIRYALDGDVNIAITTRVESDFDQDKDVPRKIEMLRKLKMFPIIGTIARYGVSKYDSGDFYVGEDHKKIKDEIKALLFPALSEKDTHYKNKMTDVDHLVGHIANNRNIFITDDRGIIRRADKLKDSFDLTVMTPSQCLEYLDLRAKKDVLVQQVYDKIKTLHDLILRVIHKGYNQEMEAEYTQLREWLLKKFPKIQDGVLNFRHRMTSVPIGGQRMFDTTDIISLKLVPRKFEDLYMEDTLREKTYTLFASYGRSTMSVEEKKRKLKKQFNWPLDLLLGYIGYLEDD